MTANIGLEINDYSRYCLHLIVLKEVTGRRLSWKHGHSISCRDRILLPRTSKFDDTAGVENSRHHNRTALHPPIMAKPPFTASDLIKFVIVGLPLPVVFP
jgi:hypothetical protein